MKIKAFSILLVLVMIFCSFPLSTHAHQQFEYPEFTYRQDLEADRRAKLNDMDGSLRKYLIEQFKNFPDHTKGECVNIASFQIKFTEKNKGYLQKYIWYDIPELFQVSALSMTGGTYIECVYAMYNTTRIDYLNKMSACETAAENLLQGIKGNTALTEVETALLVHDKLAVSCQYDFHEGANRYNMYGALVEHNAVCDGYNRAYTFLLAKCGIYSRSAVSTDLNHIWNIITVDNVEYHVDVTWDDAAWMNGERGVRGCLYHSDFLRSSAGVYETGHTTTDYDTAPNDTRYDNYFWQDSYTAFYLIDGTIYYFDSISAQLKKLVNGVSTTLLTLNSKWKSGDNTYYMSNFTTICSDGEYIFYNTNNSIYKYDPKTNSSTLFKKVIDSGNDSIYGLAIEGEYIVADINDAAIGRSVEHLREERILLQSPAQTVIPGDINGDNKVNNKDLSALFKYLSNTDANVIEAALDVNGDGKVSNKDFTRLFKYLTGYDVEIFAAA